MARGRKPALRVVGESDANQTAQQGHNSGGLNDDQRQALTRRHTQKYKELLKASKDANAALKNHGKVVKSDLGDNGMADIKLLIQLETDDGESKFREMMEGRARVARWAGMPIGVQGDLFSADRRPIEERAFEEGKSAGMDGKDCKPPYDPATDAAQEWIRGWQTGQAFLASGIKPTSDAPLLRAVEDSSDEGSEETSGPDDFDSVADGE